jgi:hypothetical protein
MSQVQPGALFDMDRRLTQSILTNGALLSLRQGIVAGLTPSKCQAIRVSYFQDTICCLLFRMGCPVLRQLFKLPLLDMLEQWRTRIIAFWYHCTLGGNVQERTGGKL